jgi:NHLM bacteriocin system ABC transporter ATP-binding protein
MQQRAHIAWLKHRLGPLIDEVSVQGDRPLLLDDPSCAYVTLSEQHELFCVGLRDGDLEGRREHLTRCEPGQPLFGVDSRQAANAALLLSGVTGNIVWRFPAAALWALRERAEDLVVIVELFERWIALLASTLLEAPQPLAARVIGAAQCAGEPSRALGADADRFVWVESSVANFQCGVAISTARAPASYWPMRGSSWRDCGHEPGALPTTEALLVAHGGGGFAADFGAFVVEVASRKRAALAAARADRALTARASEHSQLEASFAMLAAVGGERTPAVERADSDDFARACGAILGHLKLPAPARLLPPRSASPLHVRLAIARIGAVRSRGVLLEGTFWRDDAGPLLAFLCEDGTPRHPVALLPKRHGYTLYDPRAGSSRALDAAQSAQLHPQAHQFYRRLPAEPLGLWQLLRFSSARAGRDLTKVALLGLLSGLIGTAVPVLTAQLYDRIIPGAERVLLGQLVWMLLGVYVGSFLFDVARGLALLGVQTHLDSTLQAAVWDRTLSLPPRFFRDYSAGDLADRALGVGALREALSDVALTSVLAGVFSLWNVGVLLYFDLQLAAAALGLVALATGLAAFASQRELQQRRRVCELDGRLRGLLVQLFTGITKLRVSAAENRVFAVWARLFAERERATLSGERVGVSLAVFQAAFPLLCNMALAWLVVRAAAPALSTGEFLAFNAAFAGFLRAVLELIRAGSQALRAIPLYERAKPIIDSPPESEQQAGASVELAGAIELRHLSFRYAQSSELVLDDLSLRVEAGEFVAIVGASGSGKSTLLRILLGFETALQGGVYYDGQALAGLDVREVRRQIGVVLQHSQVRQGDILSNIVGSSGLGPTDAWRAARLAAFDRDIAAMPMGIYTVTTDGGGTLSAGQRQRLLIARALAAQPKILFFDEATSALDNRSQAAVRDNLDRLRVTRVVIAHRLSTICNADKIVMLEGGRISAIGRFETLLAHSQAFGALVHRQLL